MNLNDRPTPLTDAVRHAYKKCEGYIRAGAMTAHAEQLERIAAELAEALTGEAEQKKQNDERTLAAAQLAKMTAERDALLAANKWHPPTEPPSNMRFVLVCTRKVVQGKEFQVISKGLCESGYWVSDRGSDLVNVIGWRDIPPYQE